MTDSSDDTPDVVIFPPLIPLSVLVAGIFLNFFTPLGLLAHVLFQGRIVVGAIAFVAGLGMVIGANRIFRRIGTNTRPSQPTLALATTGVFKWTRNPMYVGAVSRSLALQSFSPSIGSSCSWQRACLSYTMASSYGRSAIWNASSAKNTGGTRRRSHGIGGDFDQRRLLCSSARPIGHFDFIPTRRGALCGLGTMPSKIRALPP
jgi:hypothetical protein